MKVILLAYAAAVTLPEKHIAKQDGEEQSMREEEEEAFEDSVVGAPEQAESFLESRKTVPPGLEDALIDDCDKKYREADLEFGKESVDHTPGLLNLAQQIWQTCKDDAAERAAEEEKKAAKKNAKEKKQAERKQLVGKISSTFFGK